MAAGGMMEHMCACRNASLHQRWRLEAGFISANGSLSRPRFLGDVVCGASAGTDHASKSGCRHKCDRWSSRPKVADRGVWGQVWGQVVHGKLEQITGVGEGCLASIAPV